MYIYTCTHTLVDLLITDGTFVVILGPTNILPAVVGGAVGGIILVFVLVAVVLIVIIVVLCVATR